MALLFKILLILTTVYGDAMTEGMIERIHYGWKVYHIPRYFTMYSLWGYVSYHILVDLSKFDLRVLWYVLFVVFAFLCRVLWRAVYNHFDIKGVS